MEKEANGIDFQAWKNVLCVTELGEREGVCQMLKRSGLFPKEMQNSIKEALLDLKSELLVLQVPNGLAQDFCQGEKLSFNFSLIRNFHAVPWELFPFFPCGIRSLTIYLE